MSNEMLNLVDGLNSPWVLPPSLTEGLTSGQCVQLWLHMTEAYSNLVIAAIKMKVGESGDWRSPYRQWYAAEMEKHDHELVHMLQELSRREQRRVDYPNPGIPDNVD